jgi:hypothetical protein
MAMDEMIDIHFLQTGFPLRFLTDSGKLRRVHRRECSLPRVERETKVTRTQESAANMV